MSPTEEETARLDYLAALANDGRRSAEEREEYYGLNLTWTTSPNADYYDIFRGTNSGPLTWTGRSNSTAYADATVPPGASVSYVVRARNDNTFLDSATTAVLVREIFRITSITRTGPGGQNIALTFPGYPGSTCRVQQSNTLVPGNRYQRPRHGRRADAHCADSRAEWRSRQAVFPRGGGVRREPVARRSETGR